MENRLNLYNSIHFFQLTLKVGYSSQRKLIATIFERLRHCESDFNVPNRRTTPSKT